MELKEELELIKERFKRIVGSNSQDCSDGEEDTYVTHIARAVGEIEASITKLENGIRK